MKFSKKNVFKLNVRSEVDQKSRALNALIEDPGSSPSTHMSAQRSVTQFQRIQCPLLTSSQNAGGYVDTRHAMQCVYIHSCRTHPHIN